MLLPCSRFSLCRPHVIKTGGNRPIGDIWRTNLQPLSRYHSIRTTIAAKKVRTATVLLEVQVNKSCHCPAVKSYSVRQTPREVITPNSTPAISHTAPLRKSVTAGESSTAIRLQHARNFASTSIVTANPIPASESTLRPSIAPSSASPTPDSSASAFPTPLQPPSPITVPTPYQPPKTGLLAYLPAFLVPYAELSRLDKPAGTIYLFLPCLFSTLLAAPLTTPLVPPIFLLTTTILFFTGALIMRGAGCTVNDLWDRNLDPHVTRTRHRPIARGAITVPQALTYTVLQSALGLLILLQFPQPTSFYYGAPSLALVATYPLAKRVTHYPQFVLGLTFSWGAIMGFPALGIPLLTPDLVHLTSAGTGAACLYASCVAWTVLYDMIYAHMDIKDDAKVGIKSIALRHEANTKAVLSGLAVVQVALLACAGAAVGAGPAFYVGTCGGAGLTLATMIARVNLKSVENCWWWFRYGCWLTGGAIASGMVAEYVIAA